ncbi:MAG: GTPase domain-containing protein [Nitrospirota bacterium]|nr:GTPase domain-containing protein [Nitrospirota bacterium]
MIEYDETESRMVLKLVYYGPALSGKTTNLLNLHEQLEKKGRGDLMVLDTRDDRTIFFDLLPFYIVSPGGLKIKLKVFTVPGQVKHDATRKAVLQRADGVAFIADSQVAEATNNSQSFENLESNLAIVGLDIDTIPLVIQFNKRDLDNIIPDPEVERIWKPTGIPFFYASALEGWGIVETFKSLLELTYTNIDHRYGLDERYGLDMETFIHKLTKIYGPGQAG